MTIQHVGMGEITENLEIKLIGKIKEKLKPGEKVRIVIDQYVKQKEVERKEAIKYLKKISLNSILGLYEEKISRDDAHERVII